MKIVYLKPNFKLNMIPINNFLIFYFKIFKKFKNAKKYILIYFYSLYP